MTIQLFWFIEVEGGFYVKIYGDVKILCHLNLSFILYLVSVWEFGLEDVNDVRNLIRNECDYNIVV